MSVAKSFFDITTGRNHGVIPTSDAVRIVLDAGATLMLDRTDAGEIRASAAWEVAEGEADQNDHSADMSWNIEGVPFRLDVGSHYADMLEKFLRQTGEDRRGKISIVSGDKFRLEWNAARELIIHPPTGRRIVLPEKDIERVADLLKARYSQNTANSETCVQGDAPVDLLHRTFSCVKSAYGARVDRALSALVAKLLTGESGVEVTEWTVPRDARRVRQMPPSGQQSGTMFGRLWVPLFAVGDNTGEQVNDHIARLLIRDVEEARQDRTDRIDAIVVRCGDMVGVACLSERPEPPVGATLTGRRMVGGTPSAEVPWEQVLERSSTVRLAIDALRRDCELAGLDLPSYTPRLSVLFRDGRQSAQVELMTWAAVDGGTARPALAKIVKGMVMRAAGHDPVSLRLTALPRTDEVLERLDGLIG